MTFAYPWWLLLLLAALPVAFLRNRAGSPSSIRFSSLSLLASLGSKPRRLAGFLTTSMLILAIAAAAIALARPQLSRSFTDRSASGIDIILSIDVSLSMEIRDFTDADGFQHTRTDIARAVVKNFIKQRPNDRIGIIPFAGQPYQESPITLQHEFLLEKLDDVHPSRELSQGTAIGSAIAASSIQLLKQEDTKSRIIVLVTDGSNNTGRLNPIAAAEDAAKLGIKIYTVAIGTADGRLPSAYQNFPDQEFDTETLVQVAKITGGEYFRAKTTDDLLDSFQSIDSLEKTDRKRKEITIHKELHQYFSAAAGVCLLIHIALLICLPRPGPQ